MLRLLSALALAAGLACAACSPAAIATPAKGSGATAEDQLRQAVGDAACSGDAQCRTLAWGAKACGGPERWVAWSTQRSDGAALEALAQRHAAERRSEQERKGMVSTCNVVPDPGARCVAQRCQLNNAVAPATQ